MHRCACGPFPWPGTPLAASLGVPRLERHHAAIMVFGMRKHQRLSLFRCRKHQPVGRRSECRPCWVFDAWSGALCCGGIAPTLDSTILPGCQTARVCMSSHTALARHCCSCALSFRLSLVTPGSAIYICVASASQPQAQEIILVVLVALPWSSSSFRSAHKSHRDRNWCHQLACFLLAHPGFLAQTGGVSAGHGCDDHT